MNPSLSTQTFTSFVDFSAMMSRETRREFVEMVFRHFHEPDFQMADAFPQSQLSSQFENWAYILRRLAQENTFRPIGFGNSEISQQICQDVVEWAKKIHLQIQKEDSYALELQNLAEVQQNKNTMKWSSWHNILKNLNQYHPEKKTTWAFYQQKWDKLKKIISNMRTSARDKAQSQSEVQALQHKILEDWENVLDAKRLAAEKNALDHAFSKWIGRLNAKYEKLLKLYQALSPFFGFFGKFWDLSNGAWQKMDWAQLEKYAEILKQDQGLQELARMLGRYQQSSEEYEQEILEKVVIQYEWKANASTKSEIIGIHFSDDLSNLLPSETALLSDLDTETLFAKNFVEKKLLTWEYQGRMLSSHEMKQPEVKNKAKEDEKGPIILCVDTSGSMSGMPERIAKTIVFAVVSLAIKEKRKCYLISFSTQIQTLDMANIEKSLPHLIEFLSMSFNGGTDATPAFNESLKMLESEHYEKADVLMISDFIMPSLPEETVKKIQARQKNDTRFHCVIISDPQQHHHAQHIFDHFWIYDGHEMKGTVQKIYNITRR